MKKTLYMVIPCYNEEEVVPETARRLLEKFKMLDDKITPASRIVFVNDGSRDRTWELICELCESNPVYGGINLSRNRGHQNALLAGLLTVKDHCDMVISMDADLQDDIDAIDQMIDKCFEGCDVVYGVRSSRATDTRFKRATAEWYYRIMKAMGVNMVFNHADYRLLTRKALDGLASFREVNLFLRGIIPMVGYKSDVVYYERQKRFAGESKYPLKKMLAFAFEGITSLSVQPIRMILFLGSAIFVVSILMLIWSVVGFFRGTTVPGWASLMVSIWGIGGLQLLAIGIVGEYIGKIYLETKHRPRYLLDEVIIDYGDAEDELSGRSEML